jgi:hypothetical protein
MGGKHGEPWGWDKGDIGDEYSCPYSEVVDRDENLVADMRNIVNGDDRGKRLVLAVNACTGLSDAALSQDVIGQARNALSMAETVWSTALAHRHGGEPKEQREPVLNAIRAALALLATEGE